MTRRSRVIPYEGFLTELTLEPFPRPSSPPSALPQKLLKCGTCRIRFKSVVITRCYHVFCKECIDIRIETRQRKCPTCGLGFGATDVQQIYLN